MWRGSCCRIQAVWLWGGGVRVDVSGGDAAVFGFEDGTAGGSDGYRGVCAVVYGGGGGGIVGRIRSDTAGVPCGPASGAAGGLALTVDKNLHNVGALFHFK